MDTIPRRRIVVGVTGSAPSLAALRWAADEARRHGARLHAVQVWDRSRRQLAPYARRRGRPTAQQERETAHARLLAAVRTAFGSAVPADTSIELADGLTARVLLDRAADADLLVLGAADMVPHTGLAAGPVQRACLRHARCPVVIVSAANQAADNRPASGAGGGGDPNESMDPPGDDPWGHGHVSRARGPALR